MIYHSCDKSVFCFFFPWRRICVFVLLYRQWFVDRCLSFCSFSFCHGNVCPVNNDFWLPIWYIHTFLVPLHNNIIHIYYRWFVLWMWIIHVNVILCYECGSIMSTSHRRWSLWYEMRWKDHFKQSISTIGRVSRIWKRGEGNVIIAQHEKTVKFAIIFYVYMHGQYACWLVYKKTCVVMRQICLLPKATTFLAFKPPPFNCPRCLMDRMIPLRTVDRSIDTWKCQTKTYWISILCFFSE